MTPEGESRAAAAVETSRACLRTLRYCLRWGGALAESDQLLALLDCAQACQKLAERAREGADDLVVWLEGCAEACERCARKCDRFDDLELRECAQMCRYCAPVCRRPL